MDNQRKRIISLFTGLCLVSLTTLAQSVFNGQIKDSNGEPLPGATIVEVGTRNGVTTDNNGNFFIKVAKGKRLRVSYVGFDDQIVTAGSNMNVTMKENARNLDELVVVGYGMQHKRDLVGTISQVGGEVLQNRTNPNITRSLQGEIPGLTITMRDGKPIRSGGLHIRGTVNSIGAGGSALVLVDGVEGDLNAVNPDDVENVSVLKDASSAAIYGARGAFGVILVTTKKAAKGSPQVHYSGSVSLQQRTVKPEMVTNGLQWATNFHEAYVNSRGSEPGVIGNVFNVNNMIGNWDKYYLELQKRNSDPSLEKVVLGENGYYQYYGNTDWFDLTYRDNSLSTRHNLSVTGGNDKAAYYISGGYNYSNGIYKIGRENFHTFNFKSKGMLKIRPWLTLENNTELWQRKYHEPVVQYTYSPTNASSTIPIQRQYEQQGYPVAVPRNPDGTWTEAAVYSGYAAFYEGNSWREYKDLKIKSTVTLTADVIKDILQFKGDFTYNHDHATRNQVGLTYTGYNGPTLPVTHQTFSYLENRFYNSAYLASNIYGTFTPKLGAGNHFTAMAGWNIEDDKYKSTRIYRRNLLSRTKANFDFANGDYFYINDNGSYSWGFVGWFYRLNYNWKGRYLVETSGRYDGTSKFPTNSKWGFFPSVSAGWRISDEPFMKSLHDSFLDNLKLRLSVGSAGNGQLSPYRYLSLMSLSTSNVVVNGSQLTYTTAPSPVPANLTWEKAVTYNVGLDADLFRGRLGLTFDIYRKNTLNMYVVGRELPAVYGNSAPKGNNADLCTNGWEASVSWRDHFMLGRKPFKWSVKGSIWDSKSKITKYTSTTKILSTVEDTHYYEGMEIGEIWGYKGAGFFQSDEDVLNSASQSYFRTTDNVGEWHAGDIKFMDINGDKKIDPGNNTLENHGDLVKIGNKTPRYCYSFSASANWNGIGLSMFWQGVGKRDWYPAAESHLFWGQYGRPYAYDLPWQDGSNTAGYDDEGNIVNPGAYWPRKVGWIASRSSGPFVRSANDKYLQKASYLRLKNVTLSYDFPQRLLSKLGFSQLKLYVSGENLLTFTPLRKHARNFDPEVIGAGDPDGWSTTGDVGEGYSYPMMKSYTFGLNIGF